MKTGERTVFIDESFYKWFGLPDPGANICYSALSIPTGCLPQLYRFETTIRRKAIALSTPRRASSNQEFKYSDFRNLSPDAIDELGRSFGYFLRKNGGKLFGFFVPAEGLFNYRVRSDHYDEAAKLKAMTTDERAQRMEEIRQEMLKDWEAAPRNLGLIKDIYTTFCGFILHYHGDTLGTPFRIIYDSRDPVEDQLLNEAVEALYQMTDRLTPGISAYYRGYTPAASSTTPGLRLIDWVAGEVRAFFYRSPELVGGDSTFEILSATWNPSMLLVNGGPFYPRPISEQVRASFSQTGRGFMMPFLKEHFAKEILTYYAQQGEARHLAMDRGLAFDMAD